MRALIWITVLAAALWGGVWFAASTALRGGVEDWFAAQAGRGLVAERSALSVAGFPSRVDVTLSDLHLADPAQGIGWRTPFLQVFSMSWKPWHLIAALPSGQQVTLPGQVLSLEGQGMLASLELHPGTDLGLNRTRVEAAALRLVSDAGWTLGAARLFAASEEDPSLAATHRLGLTVDEIALDPGLMAALGQTDLPGLAETLHLDAYATFSAPLDRHAAARQPRLTALDLRDARLVWGALQITAQGRMAAGPDGRAEGEIAVTVAGWRRLLPLAVALGWTTADQATVLARGLEVLAQAGPDPEVLNLPLRAAGGRLTLGPLPLGAAPLLR